MEKLDSLSILNIVLEKISDGVFVVAPTQKDGYKILRINRTMQKVMGNTDSVEKLCLNDVLPSKDTKWLTHLLNRVMRYKEAVNVTTDSHAFRKGGQRFRVRLQPVLEGKDIRSIIGIVQIISEDVQQEVENSSKREHYQTALEYAPYGVCFVGKSQKPFMVNRTLSKWLDKPINILKGDGLNSIIHPGDRAIFRRAISRTFNEGCCYQGVELRLITSSGKPLWVSASLNRVGEDEDAYVSLQFVDIEKRKAGEDRWVKQATIDHLTGIANRMVFEKELQNSIKNARRYGRKGAVVFIDMNDFKSINDNYGHKVGDKVLKSVAEVLKDVFRDTDTIARLGGDEFAVLMDEADETEALWKTKLLQSAIDAIRIPHEGSSIKIAASLGFKIFNKETTLSADEIVEHADKAMYGNKAEQKEQVVH